MVCRTPQVYHRIEVKDTQVRDKNTWPEIHVRKCLSMDTFGIDIIGQDGMALHHGLRMRAKSQELYIPFFNGH